MGEILLILWVSLVLVMLAGGILGFQLGKALTIKEMEKQRMEWLIDLDEILNKEDK